MPSFIIKVLVSAVALWVATLVVSGVEVGGDTTTDKAITIVLVAAIFGLVNAVIKPVVTLLALPAFILTLGLITFLINALMLWITAWIADKVDLSFEVADFFWSAVLGALVVSVVSFVLNVILPDGR